MNLNNLYLELLESHFNYAAFVTACVVFSLIFWYLLAITFACFDMDPMSRVACIVLAFFASTALSYLVGSLSGISKITTDMLGYSDSTSTDIVDLRKEDGSYMHYYTLSGELTFNGLYSDQSQDEGSSEYKELTKLTPTKNSTENTPMYILKGADESLLTGLFENDVLGYVDLCFSDKFLSTYSIEDIQEHAYQTINGTRILMTVNGKSLYDPFTISPESKPLYDEIMSYLKTTQPQDPQPQSQQSQNQQPQDPQPQSSQPQNPQPQNQQPQLDKDKIVVNNEINIQLPTDNQQ